MSYIQILIPWHNLTSKLRCALTKCLRAGKALEQFPIRASHPALWPLQRRCMTTGGEGSNRKYAVHRSLPTIFKNLWDGRRGAVNNNNTWANSNWKEKESDLWPTSSFSVAGTKPEWRRHFEDGQKTWCQKCWAMYPAVNDSLRAGRGSQQLSALVFSRPVRIEKFLVRSVRQASMKM